MANNSVVTLSQVINIVEEACSTVNSNINKKIVEGGGGNASLEQYTTSLTSESYVYDSDKTMYYNDIQHNLGTTNVDITVSDEVGASYPYAISAKTENSIRIWLLEDVVVTVIVTALKK